MKVFLVVDAQKDFITGKLGSKAAQKAAPMIANAIDIYRKNGYTICFTRDEHNDKDYSNTLESKLYPAHCITGTEGFELVAEIKDKVDPENDMVFCKNTFASADLANELIVTNDSDENDPITEIVICGFCTDLCVLANATVLRTLFPDVKIKLLQNLCAGSNVAAHFSAISIMHGMMITIGCFDPINTRVDYNFYSCSATECEPANCNTCSKTSCACKSER